MPSFNRYFTSSPVLAMQPQAVHQGPLSKPFSASTFSLPASWAQQLVSNNSAAGRKRSRDEAAVNLDAPEKIAEPVVKEPEDEWIYGPGMTLIKKNSSYVADASSQSGTWVEEKAAKEDAIKTEAALQIQEQLAQERPSLRSNKSQRLTPNASSNSINTRSSPLLNPMSSSDSLEQPIVDDFTIHLGIGWSRISDDERIQAAARGWARYIENHFPVTNAKILLESRGLQSYLVEANEGYFLFAENLRQGRLVSKTSDRAMENLRSSPPVFDGIDTMEATTQTPKPQPTAVDFFSATPSSIDIDMN